MGPQDGHANGGVGEGGIEMSRKSTWRSENDEIKTRKSTAFEPDLDFDMIDFRQPSGKNSLKIVPRIPFLKVHLNTFMDSVLTTMHSAWPMDRVMKIQSSCELF